MGSSGDEIAFEVLDRRIILQESLHAVLFLFQPVHLESNLKQEKATVLMFIYGGGFTEGASSVAFYDGMELVANNKDVIAVENDSVEISSAAAVQEKEEHSKTTTQHIDEVSDPFLHKGNPSKSQFNVYVVDKEWTKTLWLAFWVPWKLHLYPIVHYAAFVVSWSASCFLTVNLTQSQALTAPPYNWSSQAVGFTNFALLAATKKNGGVREPEMRLPTMIPYVLIAILGNFMIAYGYEHQWDWRVIVIVGYTCAGIQVAALPTIASTYVVDSYKPAVGSILVAITVNKNLWGYGFSKFITPWTESAGYLPAIMTNMCLTVFWCSFGFLFYFAGKNYFRKWTAKSSIWNLESH
ncbi:MFS transporter [Penicillium cataractarum]|uniref:MFS transporter n=1 Tax=Penicillium cataractarum TaxID=2100454 RepID=A0A9W9S1F3_9EURO|nr:MFS transporter [Penicillium cataractarum]KAJ5368869.1 MFS transporter [Penicillium cataractarum]